jgi:hypothetical protein
MKNLTRTDLVLDAVKELQRYIQVEYQGNIDTALASIGGLRRIRSILGLSDYAVLDSRLYHVQEKDVK